MIFIMGASDLLKFGLRQWATEMKRNIIALWIAARDKRTPLSARWVAAFVAAYALSPIDLIPDFIPIVGYLDDLIILPLGIFISVRLIPPDLMTEYREQANAFDMRPSSRRAVIIIVIIWLVVSYFLIRWFFMQYHKIHI
jgi:uncharacterized membrane protein YkvA (DUF1232 family)